MPINRYVPKTVPKQAPKPNPTPPWQLYLSADDFIYWGIFIVTAPCVVIFILIATGVWR